jgi:hypothetical protein
LEDIKDTCLVCNKEIPPGPDYCSNACEVLALRRDIEDLKWFLKSNEKEIQYREHQAYSKGVHDGSEAGVKLATDMLNRFLSPMPIYIDTEALDLSTVPSPPQEQEGRAGTERTADFSAGIERQFDTGDPWVHSCGRLECSGSAACKGK